MPLIISRRAKRHGFFLRCEKKEQGGDALLQKLCRPFIPAILGFDLDWRSDACLSASGFLPRLGPPDPPCDWTWKRTRRPSGGFCHHFRQRLFKVRAFAEMIGNWP